MEYTALPKTIELDWERFYTEYPDVYDRFAVSSIEAIKYIVGRFGLQDKEILDVGSGTGISTYEIARYARKVTGIEPWKQMREYAESKRKPEHQNVEFLDYAAESDDMNFADESFDAIISIYAFPFWFVEEPERGYDLAKKFVLKARQLLKEKGVMITVGNSTGWEAGEITSHVLPEADYAEVNNRFMEGYLGFAYEDVTVKVDYGTVENMLATYGFIFGSKALEHIEKNAISQIDWKLRVHYIYKYSVDG